MEKNKLPELKMNRAQAKVIVEPEDPTGKLKLTKEQIQEAVIQELTWQLADQIMKNTRIHRFKVEGNKELYISDVFFAENPRLELFNQEPKEESQNPPSEKEIKLPKLQKVNTN